MSFGMKLGEGKSALPSPRKINTDEQTQKNISKLLRNNGDVSNSNDIAYATETALNGLSVSVTNSNKNFSLLDEQTTVKELENPNIPTNKKKRGETQATVSFPSDEDPFYASERAKPLSQTIDKSNKDRKTTYTKSIPVANYLATINSGK